MRGDNNSGVNEVIGVLLMVAITIAIAAIVYFYVTNMINDETEYDQIINDSVIIDNNYHLVKIIYNEYNQGDTAIEVSMKLQHKHNYTGIIIDGFILWPYVDPPELTYDGNNDIIRLKWE